MQQADPNGLSHKARQSIMKSTLSLNHRSTPGMLFLRISVQEISCWSTSRMNKHIPSSLILHMYGLSGWYMSLRVKKSLSTGKVHTSCLFCVGMEFEGRPTDSKTGLT